MRRGANSQSCAGMQSHIASSGWARSLKTNADFCWFYQLSECKSMGNLPLLPAKVFAQPLFLQLSLISAGTKQDFWELAPVFQQCPQTWWCGLVFIVMSNTHGNRSRRWSLFQHALPKFLWTIKNQIHGLSLHGCASGSCCKRRLCSQEEILQARWHGLQELSLAQNVLGSETWWYVLGCQPDPHQQIRP